MEKKWLDKYAILKSEDADMLEAASAVHEFKNGLSREAAESAAHADYLKGHALNAMAHHLLGSKAALAVGNEEAAMQHGKGYEEAAKHSGYGLDKVPDEVKAIVNSQKFNNVYRHKPHEADVFFLPKDESGKVGVKVTEPHLDNIKIKSVIEGLDKLKGLLA